MRRESFPNETEPVVASINLSSEPRRGGRDDGATVKCQAQIRRGQSCATDARDAAREFHAAVAQPEMALVVFFCSGQYDPGVLALELDRVFRGVQVVGCTTADEFGPAGCRDWSISGASFPAASFSLGQRAARSRLCSSSKSPRVDLSLGIWCKR